MRSPGTAPVSSEMLSAVPRATPRTGTRFFVLALGLGGGAAPFFGILDLDTHGLEHVARGQLAAADGGQRILDIAMAELWRCCLEGALGERLAVLGEKPAR